MAANGACMSMQEVIGPLYAQMVARAALTLGYSPAYLNLWPTRQQVVEPWKTLEESIYKSLDSLPVLYTEAGTGSWLPADEVVFATEADARLVLIERNLSSIRNLYNNV